MKITVAGWKRDHGARPIVEGDVAEAPLNEEERFSWGKTTVKFLRHKHSAPEIKVFTSAELKGLNGDYLVELRFTQTEIAKLFSICFAEEALSSVVQTLSKME